MWQDHGRWVEFKMYLARLSEGEDSDGVPIMLDRYVVQGSSPEAKYLVPDGGILSTIA